MKSDTSRPLDHILIRSANWVGDAIMTTPALRAVRNNFPLARIALLAKPWVAPVFEHNPDINEIIIYQNHGRHGGLIGLHRLAREIRRRRFDGAILFQNAFFSKAHRKLGNANCGGVLFRKNLIICTA